MATGYKIKNADIDTIFESFTPVEQSTYGVTASKFSDLDNSHKNRNSDLGSTTIIPTSAGSYLGGANSTDRYKFKNAPIDVALKGRRPIGILLATITGRTDTDAPIFKYINNLGVQGTWLSDSPNVASGTRLPHDPQVVFIELQGAGGGGGASGLSHASAGGGSGAYGVFKFEIPVNQYIKIGIGGRGNFGGENGRDEQWGGIGGTSTISINETVVETLKGGTGGDGKPPSNPDPGKPGQYSGDAQYKIFATNGAYGGKKEKNGSSIPAASFSWPKPESNAQSRPAFPAGTTNNRGGGGGGASLFGKGGNSSYKHRGDDGGIGAGGGGGGFKQGFQWTRGGIGGPAQVKIYY